MPVFTQSAPAYDVLVAADESEVERLRALQERGAANGLEGLRWLNRDQMTEMIRVFLPATSNEARLTDQIDAHINKAVELGFLRPAKNSEQVYEVRRILKAFVDGQWLADFDARLAEYAALLAGEERE